MQTQQLLEKVEEGSVGLWQRFLKNPLANLFDMFVLPILIFIGIGVNAQSFRNTAPTLARAVMHIRFLHIRIETAHILAVLFITMTFVAVVWAIKRIRDGVPEGLRCPPFEFWFPVLSAIVLACADCALVYYGLINTSIFTPTKIQKIPLLLALAYTAVTLWLGYLHCVLRDKENER